MASSFDGQQVKSAIIACRTVTCVMAEKSEESGITRSCCSRLLLLGTWLLRSGERCHSKSHATADEAGAEEAPAARNACTVRLLELASLPMELPADVDCDVVPGILETALVTVLLRGISFETLPPSPSDDASGLTPLARYRVPGNATAALAVLMMLLPRLAVSRPDRAAESLWRMLWSTLQALRAIVTHADANAPQLRGLSRTAVAIRIKAPLVEFMSGDVLPDDTAIGTAGADVDVALTGGNVALPPIHREREGDADAKFFEEAQSLIENRRTSMRDDDTDRLATLLNSVGRFLEWGECTACGADWCWERDGSVVAITAEETLAAAPQATDTDRVDAVDVDPRWRCLRGLERWLLEHAALPPGKRCEKPDGIAECAEDATAARGDVVAVISHGDADRTSQSAMEGSGEVDDTSAELLRVVVQAAAAEEAHADNGAAGGERLGRATWWHEFCASLPGASPAFVVLSVMAAEHAWVWGLPWTAGFRLRMSHALFAVQSAVKAASESRGER